MKIPEFELKWSHVVLAVFLSVLFVLNILLLIEFKANQFRGNVINNSNNITAIVQVLQQKGIIQAPQPQAIPPVTVPEVKPETEKK